jgi:hypothetical protein
MLRLIKFLFTGDWHLHQWQEIDKQRVLRGADTEYIRYISKCKHCGKIKHYNAITSWDCL